MRNFATLARCFYAICIVGLAAQQFYYGSFNPVLIPLSFSPFPGEIFLVYLISMAMIVAAGVIVLEKKARAASLLLGVFFLALFVFCHAPFELWIDPHGWHLGTWTKALKASALAGGAFVVAGSFFGEPQRFTLLGSVLFSVTIVVFGIDHLLYPEFVKTLVPDWIPGHLFWTYFSAFALIGAGMGIVLRIRVKLVAMLLGIMLFIWLLVLHIPRAVVAPVSDNGNELSSVFEALGFSGIAFLISYRYKDR